MNTLNHLREIYAEQNGDAEIVDIVWEMYQNGYFDYTEQELMQELMNEYSFTKCEAEIVYCLLKEFERDEYERSWE